MAYQDYDWACRGRPLRWRVAELYARTFIGVGWAIALFWGVSMLLDTPMNEWSAVAAGALMILGVELALPERRTDE